MACGILVHKPGVRPKLLQWELQVQTTGLTENLRPQGIFIRVRSHGGPHLTSLQTPVLEVSGQTTSKTGTQSYLQKKKNETAKKYVTDEGAR